MSAILNEPVLVLSKNWLPMETCTARKAFVSVFAEKALFVNIEDCSTHDFMSWASLEVLDGQPCLKTARMHIRLPEVVVLSSPGRPEKKRDTIVFSRRNLMKRDRHICQYCGKQFQPADLTIDHILPKTRGGKSAWLNCVMSCFDCNSFKSNRTPAEAGMALLNKPSEPRWSPIFRVPHSRYKESWKQFVPETCFA
jgi:5-methylcytosine-specific restriction endonuclease McrA